MFTPTIINLNDPQMKQYITNYCNFYHEKLSKWITSTEMTELGELTENDILLSKEFEERYKDNIPQSVKEISKNILGQLNSTN